MLVLDVLPRTFSTPMFWNDEDLKELEGTDIVGKIGKDDAEATYKRDVEPLVEVRKRKTRASKRQHQKRKYGIDTCLIETFRCI